MRTLYTISVTAVCLTAPCLAAQPPAPAPQFIMLSGVITDASRAPIADVDVRLTVGGVESAAMHTRSDGHYAVSGPAGSAVLTVRRLGFQARQVRIDAASLRANGTRAEGALDVVLVAAAQDVDGVTVVDDPSTSNARIASFQQRRSMHRGGYFLDLAELRKKKPQRASDAIRGAPGVTLVPSGRIGSAVRFRNCQPMVWVDGVRTPDAELDEVVGVNDMAAIEVYVSPATVPAQFRDLRNPCGAILVWTR